MAGSCKDCANMKPDVFIAAPRRRSLTQAGVAFATRRRRPASWAVGPVRRISRQNGIVGPLQRDRARPAVQLRGHRCGGRRREGRGGTV